MAIRGVIAQLGEGYLYQALFLGPLDYALAKDTLKHLGEDSNNVYPHNKLASSYQLSAFS
jgi:hypothetical protein